MNKKTIIFIVATVLILIGLFFVFLLLKQDTITIVPIPERPNINTNPPGYQPPTSTTTQTTPPPTPIPPKEDSTFNIPTKDGNITVSNFYKTAQIMPYNDAVAASTQDYRIFYNNAGKTFIITLLSQPIAAAKDKAEQAFLKILNISTENACSLNVTVGTVTWVDPKYAGKELGLSFCKIQSF